MNGSLIWVRGGEEEEDETAVVSENISISDSSDEDEEDEDAKDIVHTNVKSRRTSTRTTMTTNVTDSSASDDTGAPTHIPHSHAQLQPHPHDRVNSDSLGKERLVPRLAVGARVEVLWEGELFAAEVMQRHRMGEYDVMYEKDGTVRTFVTREEHRLAPLEEKGEEVGAVEEEGVEEEGGGSRAEEANW
jgi:hypothetical protein